MENNNFFFEFLLENFKERRIYDLRKFIWVVIFVGFFLLIVVCIFNLKIFGLSKRVINMFLVFVILIFVVEFGFYYYIIKLLIYKERGYSIIEEYRKGILEEKKKEK